jgi:hypothetical protein
VLVTLEPRFAPVVAAGPPAAAAAGGRVRGASFGDRGAAGVHGQRGGDLGPGGGGRAESGRRPGPRIGGRRVGRLRIQPSQAALWRALAAAGIDWAALREAETEAVIETLVALPGVGRWTAEIYAKFALGHADVFAAGDLACRKARGGFSVWTRALRGGVARDGRGLVAGACGCCPGAVGLLPLGH